jgi:hypothetical protein
MKIDFVWRKNTSFLMKIDYKINIIFHSVTQFSLQRVSYVFDLPVNAVDHPLVYFVINYKLAQTTTLCSTQTLLRNLGQYFDCQTSLVCRIK